MNFLRRSKAVERLNPGEISPLDRVAAYQPLWSEYRRRNLRTLGLDTKLAGEWGVISRRMDELLEALFDSVVEPFQDTAPYERKVQNFRLGKQTLYEPQEYEGA